MREVTREQFYAKICPLDVVGSILNARWPYTHEFHIRSNRYNIVGRIVGELDGECGVFDVRRYYLA